MSDEPEAVKERASPASITSLFPDINSRVPPTGIGALVTNSTVWLFSLLAHDLLPVLEATLIVPVT